MKYQSAVRHQGYMVMQNRRDDLPPDVSKSNGQVYLSFTDAEMVARTNTIYSQPGSHDLYRVQVQVMERLGPPSRLPVLPGRRALPGLLVDSSLEILRLPEVLFDPLTLPQIKERLDEHQFITGTIVVSLDDIRNHADGELFNDLLSQRLIDSDLLMDIFWQEVGWVKGYGLLLTVTGNVSGHLENYDEESTDEQPVGSQ